MTRKNLVFRRIDGRCTILKRQISEEGTKQVVVASGTRYEVRKAYRAELAEQRRAEAKAARQ